MPSTAPRPPRDARQEFANTLTHAAGVVLSLVGAVALLASCTHWTIALACGL
jgi:predicted membrane channel-forming protein YqfA (hemolysin III family)